MQDCLADGNLTIGQSGCGCSPADEEIVGNCYECMDRLAPAVSVAISDGETPSILAQEDFNGNYPTPYHNLSRILTSFRTTVISVAYLELCSSEGVTLPSVILSGTAPVQVPGTSSASDSSQSTISGIGSSPTSGSSKNGALGMHEEMIILIGYPLFLLLLGVLRVI